MPESRSTPVSPLSSASAAVDPSRSGSRALHLRADGVSHSYAGRRVLTDVSLVVPAGTPTGLLGENGSGKSTLLRLLAGDETPDAGTIDAPGPIGLLAQEAPFPADWSVGRVVADALSHATALEQQLDVAAQALADVPDDAAAASRYDALLTAAQLTDVWGAPARAEAILAGLDADLPRERRIDEISGGQRGRLMLARLLIARPLTLLLDEPTNHLDDAGAEFLAQLLAEHPGPVLVASHDRAFLDEATAGQVDLDPAASPLNGSGGGATAYTGTVSDYIAARLDARERWERRHREEQEEMSRLREVARESQDLGRHSAARVQVRGARKYFSDRNAVRVKRHVRDAERRLDELERAQVRKPPLELHFTGLPPGGRGAGADVLLAASGVAVDGRLAPTSFALSAGEKLLVTGANGAGKSTLLDVLAGVLEPDAGTVQRSRGLRLGHLAQDEDVDSEQTPAGLLAAASAASSNGAPSGPRAGRAPRPTPSQRRTVSSTRATCIGRSASSPAVRCAAPLSPRSSRAGPS